MNMYEVSSKSDNGKGFKNRGKVILRLLNFFSKRNLDTRFEISSVGIPEISPYTKYRMAGKHLTRHAKNGYAAVAIADPASAGPPIFGRVGNRCR